MRLNNMEWLASLAILIAALVTLQNSVRAQKNVAIHKETTAMRNSGNQTYRKSGDKDNLVDGNRTATFSDNTCSGCFLSNPITGYWQVNLGQKYFVAYVTIVGVSGFTNNLPGLSIVVFKNEDEADEEIQINYNSNQRIKQYNLQFVRYVQYVRIQYVGDSDGILLGEVEVHGFSDLVPRGLTVNNVSGSSVDLRWQRPLLSSVYTIVYEYNCGGSSWTEERSSNGYIEAGVTGLESSRHYTCSVRVKHSTDEITASGYTLCTNNFNKKPENILFGTPRQVEDAGRQRWRYNITWRLPVSYREECLHTTKPYGLNVDGTLIATHGNSFYLYEADGYEQATITVWSRNRNDDLSSSTTKTITTSTGLPPQIAPCDVALTSQSYDCVEMSYSPVQYRNAPSSQTVIYQYKCTQMGSWQTVPQNKRKCGYSAYEDVTCQIRAHNVNINKYSQIASASEHTKCQNPDEVRNILYNKSAAPVTNEGRLKWKYTLTWQDPSNSKCESIRNTDPYEILGGGYSTWTAWQTKQYEFYTDRYEQILFRVKVYNNKGLSSAAKERNFRTANLPPQSAPTDFTLRSSSSNCVLLSWSPPDHLNSPSGHVTYQYNCNSQGWIEVPDNKQICGFSPFTSVSCKLRARNLEGPTSEITKTTKTYCAGPSKPRSVSFDDEGLERNENRIRRKYKVTWLAPTTPNCDAVISYTFKDQHGTWHSTSNRYYFIHIDGNVQISVEVKALNNQNNVSVAESKSTVTASFYPQVAPRSFSLTNTSSGCVILSWIPPQYPNGVINGYKYNCSGGNTLWSTVGGTSHQKQDCGHLPYSDVTCELKATNSNGDSDASTMTRKTSCDKPSQPRNIVFTDQGTDNTSGRIRRKHRVSWTDPERFNCLSLRSSNKYSFKNPDGIWQNTGNNYITVFSEGNVQINVELTATNNENFVSLPTYATYTTLPLRPQKQPLMVELFSTTPRCVTMTWDHPQYPNGPLQYYQYKCTGDGDWVMFPGDGTLRSGTRCEYSPYTQVSCQLRARNGEGWSDTASVRSIRTLCDYPALPEDLAAYLSQDMDNSTGTPRRRIKLNLPIQDINPNCEEVKNNGILYLVVGTEKEVQNTFPITDLDAVTKYSLLIMVRNDQGFQTNTTVVYETGELVLVQRCKAPPEITNAHLLSSSEDNKLGAQAFYQCDTNIISGEGVSTCKETPSGLDWSENTLVCKERNLVAILVGVLVPVLVIVGIILLVIYLKKRSAPLKPVPGPITGQIADEATVRSHDDGTYPPSYEDIELRFSAVSDTEYAEVGDFKGEQRNDKMYENFEQNQYEALQLPTNACSTDDDHLYAEAQPKY